jgi:hypothetical protein
VLHLDFFEFFHNLHILLGGIKKRAQGSKIICNMLYLKITFDTIWQAFGAASSYSLKTYYKTQILLLKLTQQMERIISQLQLDK